MRRHVIERSKDPREDRKVLEEKLAEDRDPAQLGLIDAGKRLDLEEAERWRVRDFFLLAFGTCTCAMSECFLDSTLCESSSFACCCQYLLGAAGSAAGRTA